MKGRKREIRQARRQALAGDLTEADFDQEEALARLFDEIEGEDTKNPAEHEAGRGLCGAGSG